MNHFSGYEEYCNAFQNDEKRADAELIYYSRCWLNRIAENYLSENRFFGTDNFIFPEFCCEGKDALSAIICDIEDSASYISRNLHEKIIRENTLVPIYQLKEINSAGMNWISRRPGKSIREKLSGCSSVLGVHKRMSNDTGENRLFVTFLRRLLELIETKELTLPAKLKRKEESELFERVMPFLNSDEITGIARWENFPPNNTLLSDKYYRQIWNGWLKLRTLDELVENDSQNISSILVTVIFWKIFSAATQSYKFPQTPVIFDYESFTVRPLSLPLYGIQSSENQIMLSINKNKISIIVNDTMFLIELSDRNITLLKNEQIILFECITISDFEIIMQKLISKLSFKPKTKTYAPQKLSADCFIVSPFTDIPAYAVDDGKVSFLDFKIAAQKYNYDEIDNGTLSLADSAAFCIDNAEKLITMLNCADDNDAYTLFSDISKRVAANKFCFLFPDFLSEFKLTPIKKAAHLFYNEIDAIPQSIGAIFGCESEWNKENFSEKDLILVLDIVDTDLIITPIKGVIDNSLQTTGVDRLPVIWERYPTASYRIINHDAERFSEMPKLIELFPAKLSYTNRDIPLLCNGKWNTVGDMDSSGTAIYIEKYLNKYISTHKNLAENKNIKIISMTNRLLWSSLHKYSVSEIKSNTVVSGCQRCIKYTEQLGTALWKDHLPNLAIRQAVSALDLVKNQTVVPLPNEELEIKIDSIFALPAGHEKYSFELIQEDANSKMKYQAVLEHSAFPLKNTVECRLVMKYKYGADDPYTLIFIPTDKKTAAFSEVRAKWKESINDYSFCDSIYPEFPEPPSISVMHQYPSNKPGKPPSDLFNWVISSFSPEPMYHYCFTGNERWYSGKFAEYTNITVNINNIPTAVQVYDDDHNIRYNANEIFFKATLVKDKDFYRARLISTDRNQYERNVILSTSYCLSRSFTGILFPLHIILSSGRCVDADGYPPNLADAVRRNIGYVWESYIKQYQQSEKDEQTLSELKMLLSVFCLLHNESGAVFYEHINEYIAEYEKYSYAKLTPNIGYAVGSCSTDAQKELFDTICSKIWRKNPAKSLNMLSRAVWKNPDMIFNANSDKLIDVLKYAIKLIVELSKTFADGSDKVAEYTKHHNITCCFEYILAMFRLRKLNNDKINVMLRCDSNIMEKLREALYVITASNDVEFFSGVDKFTRIKLDISGNSDTDIPDIIYVLMLYASGNLEGDSIIISGISEDE